MERNEDIDSKPEYSKILVEFVYNNLDFRALCTIGKSWDDTTVEAEYNDKRIETIGSSEHGRGLISKIVTYPQCLLDNLPKGESKKLNASVLEAFYNALNAQE